MGLALTACAASATPPLAETVSIPLVDEEGQARTLEARICRPGTGPDLPHVAILNHGAPPQQSDPGLVAPASCDSEAAQWFLARNFVVVAGLRRGFGGSAGPIAEGGGPCSAPDFVGAGRRSAHDVDAIVRYALALPGVRSDGAVVVGESTGGWATIAYADLAEPGIAALIDMGGGRSGPPGTPCGGDRLVGAAGTFGRDAATPMLWIYAENDRFFPPATVRAMHDKFVAEGGQAMLALTPPFGDDGHGMFHKKGGSRVWGPILDAYLGARASRAMSAAKESSQGSHP